MNFPTERLPNGMRVPQQYGVWRGGRLSAQLTREVASLTAYDPQPPGAEWSPSPHTDESGYPSYWFVDVPEAELDRLVKVEVTAMRFS